MMTIGSLTGERAALDGCSSATKPKFFGSASTSAGTVSSTSAGSRLKSACIAPGDGERGSKDGRTLSWSASDERPTSGDELIRPEREPRAATAAGTAGTYVENWAAGDSYSPEAAWLVGSCWGCRPTAGGITIGADEPTT